MARGAAGGAIGYLTNYFDGGNPHWNTWGFLGSVALGAVTAGIVKGIAKAFAPEAPVSNRPEGFDEVYSKAPAAKEEIDSMAKGIADENGGSVAKAPIKSEARAIEKINKDYGGDPKQIKDLARNTIVVDSDKIGNVAAGLKSNGAVVKVIDASADPMGYSGVNASVRTQAGIPAEIQVNSPEMIYAKEPESIARAQLGDAAYDDIASKTGVQGGLGHTFYEQYRVLDANSPEAEALAEQSKAYYQSIRSAYAN
jgi:hypothetical protein